VTTFLVSRSYEAADGTRRRAGDVLDLDEDRSTERDTIAGNLKRVDIRPGLFLVRRAFRKEGPHAPVEDSIPADCVVFLSGEEIIGLERAGVVRRIDLHALLLGESR
jgi:hypothetical protein